jgi:hypothetical protein
MFWLWGSLTTATATIISTAIAAAHARVRIPSRTQAAPIVSTTISSTAPTSANGRPTCRRNAAVPGMPFWNLLHPCTRNTPPIARRMKNAA